VEWFIFAVIAPMLWAIVNIIDKYFLTKLIKNPFSYQILTLLTDTLILLPLILFAEISFNYPWYLWSIIIGVIIGLVPVLYNKAMTLEEASRVVPMFYLNPIFVLPLAYFFLNETLSFQKYAGVFLLVISAALISYKKLKGKFRISPALIYILLFSLVWAGYEVSTKYIFSFIDYFSFLFWTVVGALFGGLILLFIPKIRDDFIVDMRKANKKKVFFWRLITVAVYYTGVVSIYIAISIGLISLVSAIPSLQPLFVLLYTLLLSFFMPKVLSEKVSKLIIFTKILSIILIFVGTLLVVS